MGAIKSASFDSRSTSVKISLVQLSARADTNHKVGFKTQSLSVLNNHLKYRI